MTLDPVGAASFVLDTSLRALAAALAVALVLGLLRVRAAAVLHSAWRAVLVAMLLMPVLPSIVPALPVLVPAAAGDFFDSASGTERTISARCWPFDAVPNCHQYGSDGPRAELSTIE